MTRTSLPKCAAPPARPQPALRLVVPLLSALLLVAPATLAQKIYKYVDADGNVVYSQQAPKGIQAQELKPRVQRVSPDAAAKQLEALNEKARGNRENRELRERDADAATEEAGRRQSNCEQARKNLEILNSSSRVQTTDEQGNLFYLDDATKQAKTEEAQRQVQEFCN